MQTARYCALATSCTTARLKPPRGEVIERFILSRIGAIAATPSCVRVDRRYGNQICFITAARRFYPLARSILVVGGERFGLIRFDEAGRYLSYRSNPACAAGTGSFLNQQVRRFNLRDTTQSLAALALSNKKAPPTIASRCALFANTDLVLQLDEHDSRLGYETRIEAAVRAFRNHNESAGTRDTPAETQQPPAGSGASAPSWRTAGEGTSAQRCMWGRFRSKTSRPLYRWTYTRLTCSAAF